MHLGPRGKGCCPLRRGEAGWVWSLNGVCKATHLPHHPEFLFKKHYTLWTVLKITCLRIATLGEEENKPLKYIAKFLVFNIHEFSALRACIHFWSQKSWGCISYRCEDAGSGINYPPSTPLVVVVWFFFVFLFFFFLPPWTLAVDPVETEMSLLGLAEMQER